jgi:hypothetical protein
MYLYRILPYTIRYKGSFFFSSGRHKIKSAKQEFIMFPKIETITDILPHIKDQKDIRVKVEDNGFTIICYMMQGGKTFSGDNSAFALECRGITFRPDGKIATRLMQKFFNVGETAELAPENLGSSEMGAWLPRVG